MAGMIRTICLKCGRQHEFSTALAGLAVICKGCSNRLQLPPRSAVPNNQSGGPGSMSSQPETVGPADRQDLVKVSRHVNEPAPWHQEDRTPEPARLPSPLAPNAKGEGMESPSPVGERPQIATSFS